MSYLPVICEKGSIESLSTICDIPDHSLVRDFGWPTTSPRYRGDHTPASNPDWDYDPMDNPEAREGAMEKMERSYALYLANMARPPVQKKGRDGWSKFLPWRWMAVR